MDEKRKMMNALQVSETLNISRAQAYKIIAKLNAELKAAGYLVITGKVDSLYFRNRFFPNIEDMRHTEGGELNAAV